jgi:hypothetical protein
LLGTSLPLVVPAPEYRLTDVERERYRRWWIERSGLTIEELREIATAFGGDSPSRELSTGLSTRLW